MASSVSGTAPTPAVAATTTAAAAPAAVAQTGGQDTDAKAMAFQYALSAVLNAPSVLGGGGGSSVDDDDDDGSNLTVSMSL